MEQRPAHPSEWAALQAVATKLGMTGETLRKWVRQAERDTGHRPGLTTSERERLAALERENASETDERDSQDGVRAFRPGGTRRPINSRDGGGHRRPSGPFGVESIRRAPIAPSTYHRHRQQVDPARRSARAQR
jgi:transposase-like protein